MTELQRLGEGKCMACSVRRTGFCGSLDPALRGRLAGLARSQEFPANHRFCDEDGHPGFFAVLREGYMRMQRHSIDGRRQILALTVPGEMLGEGGEPQAGYGLESVTPVTLCRIERGALDRLAGEAQELRRALYAQLEERLERLRRLTWWLGVQTPEERLCGFLALACEMLPFEPLPDGGGVLTFSLPRSDIADYLNITKETISRLTHRLQAEGLIEIRDPRHFVIRDPAALARIGGLPQSPCAVPAGGPAEA